MIVKMVGKLVSTPRFAGVMVYKIEMTVGV